MPFELAYADYLPDRDTSKIPGAIADMSGFAPLDRGGYGTVKRQEVVSLNATVKMVRHVEAIEGATYVYVFTNHTIDRYFPAESGTPLTRDIVVWNGVSASAHAAVDDWSVASWGDLVIACGSEESTGGYSALPVISSNLKTGVSFAPLSGTPPNAKFVAANVDFVMLANTDSSAQAYVDEVWWSGLQNPLTWAPSIATQAGRYRLLDTPGPITALAAFRNVFLAFKKRGVYLGEYVGPPFLFNWRVINHSLGCINNRCVARLDERLYFLTDSGLQEFDGVNFRNVSGAVWKSILHQIGYTKERTSTAPGSWPTRATATVLEMTPYLAICADEIEGVIWLAARIWGASAPAWFAWAYNVRTGKWSRVGQIASDPSNDAHPNWLRTSSTGLGRTAIAYNHAAPEQQRVWFAVSNGTTNKVYGLAYPETLDTDTLTAHIDTAIVGRAEGSDDAIGVRVACGNGSDASIFSACTVYGYANESMTTGTQQATAAVNSELDRFDARLNARYRMARLTGADNKVGIVAAVGLQSKPIGRR